MRADAESGMTLVEVLVGLTIVALAVGLALPYTRSPSPSLEVRLQALRVAAALRTARATAVAKGIDVGFVFDARANAWAIEAGVAQPQALPDGTTLALETARIVIRGKDEGRLVFFSDGSATGGRIALRKGVASATVAVDWLNGAVSVDPVQP